MGNEQLIAFDAIDVADSFVLAFERHRSDYWIRALFSLTPRHPHYTLPPQNEHSCYRHGWLKALEVSAFAADWTGLVASADPDGEVDFGSIERVAFEKGKLSLDGNWGEVRVLCESIEVQLEGV